MALPILVTAMKVVGVINTISTIVNMVSGPPTITSPKVGSIPPILPMHHQYIRNQYREAVYWNKAHVPALQITNSSLVEGLNRELGLNQSLLAYQRVWNDNAES